FKCRIFCLCAGRSEPGSASVGVDRRVALPRARAAIWRSGTADQPLLLRRGWRFCRAAADGGRRSGAPDRPKAVGPAGCRSDQFGVAVPRRRLPAAAVAQPVLPLAVFCRGAAETDRAVVRMIRRHLVLFAREPRLGTGKRRLARDIGAVAALRFERLMLARLIRRLGRDPRLRPRPPLTPGPPP